MVLQFFQKGKATAEILFKNKASSSVFNILTQCGRAFLHPFSRNRVAADDNKIILFQIGKRSQLFRRNPETFQQICCRIGFQSSEFFRFIKYGNPFLMTVQRGEQLRGGFQMKFCNIFRSIHRNIRHNFPTYLTDTFLIWKMEFKRKVFPLTGR